MLRFVGFLREVFNDSLSGDVGADNGCKLLVASFAVAGRLNKGMFMSSVSFLTFFAPSSCIVGGCNEAGVRCLLSVGSIKGCVCKRNGAEGVIEVADSGDEDAELSETTGESNVELLVVGDDSVDSENNELMLPRCACGFWCRCGGCDIED